MSSVSSATSSNAAYYASQKSLFGSLDSDKDGSLSEAEFAAGKPKGPSQAQVTQMLARNGASGSDDTSDGQSSSTSSKNLRPGGLDQALSSDVMAVLMAMSQQGGMNFDAANSSGGSVAGLYAEIDADGSGSVTKAEFVAGRPDDMSEEDASSLFGSIDTGNTGSITEEQFSDAQGAGGPPPGGGSAGGGQASSDATYDALDTNQDGVVSMAEFVAAHPAEVTDEQATDLFKSLDTEDKGSLTRDQLADFLNPSETDEADTASLNGSDDMMPDISDLISMLEAMQEGSDSGEQAG